MSKALVARPVPVNDRWLHRTSILNDFGAGGKKMEAALARRQVSLAAPKETTKIVLLEASPDHPSIVVTTVPTIHHDIPHADQPFYTTYVPRVPPMNQEVRLVIKEGLFHLGDIKFKPISERFMDVEKDPKAKVEIAGGEDGKTVFLQEKPFRLFGDSAKERREGEARRVAFEKAGIHLLNTPLSSPDFTPPVTPIFAPTPIRVSPQGWSYYHEF